MWRLASARVRVLDTVVLLLMEGILRIKNGGISQPAEYLACGDPVCLAMIKRSQLHPDSIIFDRRGNRFGVVRRLRMDAGDFTMRWADGEKVLVPLESLASGSARSWKVVRLKDFPIEIKFGDVHLRAKVRKDKLTGDDGSFRYTRRLDVLALTAVSADQVSANLPLFLPQDLENLPLALRAHIESAPHDDYQVSIRPSPSNPAILNLLIESVFFSVLSGD
jgi:hypothetical protein